MKKRQPNKYLALPVQIEIVEIWQNGVVVIKDLNSSLRAILLNKQVLDFYYETAKT